MRRTIRMVYIIFWCIGIILLLLAYILTEVYKQILPGDIVKDIGIVVISIAGIDLLWKLAGGDPLREEIEQLKHISYLNQQALHSGLSRVVFNNREITNWIELINNAQTTIDFLTDTNYEIAEREDLRNAILGRVREGVHVRIMLYAPENFPTFNVGYKDPDIHEMHRRMKFVMKRLTGEIETLPKRLRKNIRIVQIRKGTIHLAIRRIDNTMILVPNMYSLRIEERPTFVIEGPDSPLFKKYASEIDILFRDNMHHAVNHPGTTV